MRVLDRLTVIWAALSGGIILAIGTTNATLPHANLALIFPLVFGPWVLVRALAWAVRAPHH